MRQSFNYWKRPRTERSGRRQSWSSFEEFHKNMSDCRIIDYMFANHRFVNFQRDEVDFDLNFSILPFGVQSEVINGRSIERPFFLCNQIDVNTLPFVSGKVDRNFPFFPWDGMNCLAFDNSWLVCSTGIGTNYSEREELLRHYH